MKCERSEPVKNRNNPDGPRQRRQLARKLKRIRRRRFLADQIELWARPVKSDDDWLPWKPSVSESDATELS